MVRGLRFRVGDAAMPPKGDIEFKIDYREGDSSPARVFDIASNLIRAFEDLDRVLVSSVDSKISTRLVLEDVDKSSLKVILRNVLRATDDDALKGLDWKQQVGAYLVRAKYVALEWLDQKISEEHPPQLEDLTDRLRLLAIETDARHLPDYPPVNPARLAQPLDHIQRTKAQFRDGEKLTITLDEAEYIVDLDRRWLPSDHLPADIPSQQLSNEMDMVLIIRKPDFLAKSQWQFRHGRVSVSAVMDVPEWIREFHQGLHVIKPGDALRVRVRFDATYDANGDLADQSTTVIKVYGVISSAAPPPGLFDERDVD